MLSRLAWCAISCVLLLPVIAQAAGATGSVDFARDVRPTLARSCFLCHGPDDAEREADLRLDTREGLLDSGVVVPGQPELSQLYRLISSDDEDERMPPPAHAPRLTREQIAGVYRWIQQGASYRQHWSYEPIRRPRLPETHETSWPRGAIDTFALARMEALGMKPSPRADPYILLRRLTLDLTGLPPTIDQVNHFVADRQPGAYERAVERLLASPAYGERWARVWLDLARYADSAGYTEDQPRKIWRYRDWVIRAINSDKPYDDFTVEQIAGDLLPDATLDQQVATGFHRNTQTNMEGGTDDEEFRVAAVLDRVNTTMQVWMGTTMGCAQCHSHKYDPFTQEEYYGLFAFLNNTADQDEMDERPTITSTPTESEQREIERIEPELAQVKAQLDQLETARSESESEAEDKDAFKAKVKKLKARVRALKRELATHQPTTPVMEELPEEERRPTHVLIRGNYRARGEEVAPGVPTVFHPIPQDAQKNRLTLGRWLVDPHNPLTPRVTANRYWEQLFGVGLVETSEDFGTQGAPPTHPQLLDWMAAELVDSGWDTRALVRRIVSSATYRQTSRVTPRGLATDRKNRWLTRGPRFRLAAETIRDQALGIGGLLSRKMFGPSVHPPKPRLGTTAAFGESNDWETSTGEDKFRRGLYTSWRRSSPYPSMATMDATSRYVCTVRRIRTNTPLAALVTLNDPVYVEAAQALARRIVSHGGTSPADRAHYAFRLCLVRPPEDKELETILSLLEDARRKYHSDLDQALRIAAEPLGDVPEGMNVVDLAAWTVVSNGLLNLDETLARP